MRPFLPSSRALALAKLLLRRSCALDHSSGPGLPGSRAEIGDSLDRFGQARCSSKSTARIGNSRSSELADARGSLRELGMLNSSQARWFLGCGDGEEGDALSKTHEERLVIGYSPEQLFAVVAAVDLYEDFLPWCQRSKITRRNSDGTFDAELEIGFKFLVENYVSHVELQRPKYIKTSASESGLFDHLINIWEFNPGPVPGTCDLHFLVDFKFHSPLYRQVASMFFKEVVSQLVGSFSDRCRRIYGPTVPVLENTTYGQAR